MVEIDWTIFDKYPEDTTVYCRCEAVYRSHVKGVYVGDKFVIFTRKPCPKCGESSGNVRRCESDPEIWTIGG